MLLNQADPLQFYFGDVPEEFHSDDDFTTDSGQHYYFKLVIGPEDFYLYDTCGRMVPVPRSLAKDFGTGLFVVNQVYEADREAVETFTKKMFQVQQLVDFWDKGAQ